MYRQIFIDGVRLKGLEKFFNRRTSSEYFDVDYVEALLLQYKSNNSTKSKEAKDALLYLNEFLNGYYHLRFKKDSTIFSIEDKRKIYDRDNSARRDIFSTQGRKHIEDEKLDKINPTEALERQRAIKKASRATRRRSVKK